MADKPGKRRGPSEIQTRFRNMRPADRVKLALEMSSLASIITLQSILDRNPRISKAKLIEEGRKRLYSGRRVS